MQQSHCKLNPDEVNCVLCTWRANCLIRYLTPPSRLRVAGWRLCHKRCDNWHNFELQYHIHYKKKQFRKPHWNWGYYLFVYLIVYLLLLAQRVTGPDWMFVIRETHCCCCCKSSVSHPLPVRSPAVNKVRSPGTVLLHVMPLVQSKGLVGLRSSCSLKSHEFII